MAREQTVQTCCLQCGFEAASGSSEWERVRYPPLGTLSQCPECGSTDLTTRD